MTSARRLPGSSPYAVASSPAYGVVAASTVYFPGAERLPPVPVFDGAPQAMLPKRASRSVAGRPLAFFPTFTAKQVHACPDAAMAAAFRDRMRAWIASTSDTNDHYRHARDTLGKWVPETGAAPGWYVLPRPAHAPTAALHPSALTYVAELLGAPAASPSQNETVPLGTNKGDPTWGSSLEDHACHLLMARDVRSEADLARIAIAQATIIDRATLPDRPCGTLFSRTGPNRKDTPLYAMIAGHLRQIGTDKGHFPRRRHVKGVPNWSNEPLRDGVMRCYRALKRHWWFDHSSMHDTARAIARFGAPIMMSDDISGFDDSVAIEHQRVLARSVLAPWLGPMTGVFLSHLTTPLLTGPTRDGDRAMLWGRRGGILSGMVSTSLEGTLLNLCSVFSCVAAGWDVSVDEAVARHRRGEWAVLVLGDDTLLLLRRPLNADAYAEAGAAMGFTRKLETFPIFLQTWYGSGGSVHGLAARAAMRTATRERPAPGPATELFGAWARWSRCAGDPMFHEMWHLVNDNPLFSLFGVRTFTDLGRVATKDTTIALAEEEIAGSQGEERWVRLLAALGRYPIEKTGPLDAVHDILMNRLGGLRALQSSRSDVADVLATAGQRSWRHILADLSEGKLPLHALARITNEGTDPDDSSDPRSTLEPPSLDDGRDDAPAADRGPTRDE